jgi:hypothetical protein
MNPLKLHGSEIRRCQVFARMDNMAFVGVMVGDTGAGAWQMARVSNVVIGVVAADERDVDFDGGGGDNGARFLLRKCWKIRP